MDVRTESLREALELLGPAVAKGKPQVPVVKYVLLQDGKAIATNLNEMAMVDVPGIEGECLLPHKAGLDALKRIPGSYPLTIEQEGGRVRLAWSGGKVSFSNAPEPNDFPAIPRVEGEARPYDGDKLTGAMQRVVPYTSEDDSRPALTGVIMTSSDGQTDVVAADGFRIALEYLPAELPVERLIIPASAVRVLAHLWKKAPSAPKPEDDILQAVLNERSLELTVGDGNVAFRFGQVGLITKPIDSQPPNYRQAMPDYSQATTVEFSAPDFERVVRQLVGTTSQLRLRWDTRTLTATARVEDEGEAEASLGVRADGEGKIAFDANYLLSYLKGREGIARMSVVDETSPAMFRCAGAPLLLQMPMLLRDETNQDEQSTSSEQDEEADENEAADEGEE